MGRQLQAVPVRKPLGAPAMSRSFGASCLNCGSLEGVRINPNGLGEEGVVSCDACGCECSIEHIRSAIATWPRVLAWLDMAPAMRGPAVKEIDMHRAAE